MKQYKIAILGATGRVGQEYIKILPQRRFPAASVKLLASDRSVGRKIQFGNDDIEVEEATPEALKGLDVAFFAAGSDISRKLAPAAAREGALVIDNSAAFRMEATVPLVVPEINAEDLRAHQGIIANPNCVTTHMVVALNPLHRVNPVKRITVDTYQSVSGTGLAALDELRTQAGQVLAGQPAAPRVYPHQIAFNVIPEVETPLENGYTKEEWKMVEETRKIMHAPDIAIAATCVRVPVFSGHSEAVHADFASPITPAEARAILAKSPGIKVIDDVSRSAYPYPIMAVGTDDVLVGRIKQHPDLPNSLTMWVVADNIRKGAALNSVQIAEEMIARAWITPRG
ncbi:MAG: aspartate-semialdehyde dehydrogenase [Chloroflexi bacterium]|nr:aspartate-semialdehyde dehydrogenase [Chloroflexota bacterium]